MRLLTDPPFLGALAGRIHDCAADPSQWQAALGDLAALIGARRGVLAVGRLIVATGDGAELPAAAGLPVGAAWPEDRPFVFSRDRGLDPQQAARFQRECLAPFGDRDCIGFVLRPGGRPLGHWMLATPAGRPPIAEEEVASLALLAPHLRRAVAIAQRLDALRRDADICRAALDRLDAAVLVLDGDRRVVQANRRAAEALEQRAALRMRGGRVHGASAGLDATLRRVIAAAAAGAVEAVVAGTDGEQRLLFAAALDDTAEPGAVMLALRAPREDSRRRVAVAARVFDLTPAQTQVLGLLVEGQPPEAIAASLGIAVTTVRTHLSDLFRRTDTARQTELVARALSFAPPLRDDLRAV